MYKLVLAVFAALVAFASAKPNLGEHYGSPLAYSYGGYGAPLAYSVPVAYGYGGAYRSPVVAAYSPYAAAPVAYAASPYSSYLKR